VLPIKLLVRSERKGLADEMRHDRLPRVTDPYQALRRPESD
jgi:hypothetical protein